jgi:hypothetical protein
MGMAAKARRGGVMPLSHIDWLLSGPGGPNDAEGVPG